MMKHLFLEMDGKKIPVKLKKSGNGMSIALGSKTYDVVLDKKGNFVTVRQSDEVRRLQVRRINGRIFETEMFGEIHRISVQEASSGQLKRNNALEESADSKPSQENIIVETPIPGTLISVEVKEGETVKRGDCICVVEAMKLYNEIESPQDGMVKEIKTSPGKSVMPGEALVVLEVSAE